METSAAQDSSIPSHHHFAGWAWNNLEHVDNRVHVLSGGLGFRYDIAARYGLHCGVDVGFSPDCTAVYLVFGSAWNRP